jgi:hypothetical protein
MSKKSNQSDQAVEVKRVKPLINPNDELEDPVDKLPLELKIDEEGNELNHVDHLINKKVARFLPDVGRIILDLIKRNRITLTSLSSDRNTQLTNWLIDDNDDTFKDFMELDREQDSYWLRRKINWREVTMTPTLPQGEEDSPNKNEEPTFQWKSINFIHHIQASVQIHPIFINPLFLILNTSPFGFLGSVEFCSIMSSKFECLSVDCFGSPMGGAKLDKVNIAISTLKEVEALTELILRYCGNMRRRPIVIISTGFTTYMAMSLFGCEALKNLDKILIIANAMTPFTKVSKSIEVLCNGISEDTPEVSRQTAREYIHENSSFALRSHAATSVLLQEISRVLDPKSIISQSLQKKTCFNVDLCQNAQKFSSLSRLLGTHQNNKPPDYNGWNHLKNGSVIKENASVNSIYYVQGSMDTTASEGILHSLGYSFPSSIMYSHRTIQGAGAMLLFDSPLAFMSLCHDLLIETFGKKHITQKDYHLLPNQSDLSMKHIDDESLTALWKVMSYGNGFKYEPPEYLENQSKVDHM